MGPCPRDVNAHHTTDQSLRMRKNVMEGLLSFGPAGGSLWRAEEGVKAWLIGGFRGPACFFSFLANPGKSPPKSIDGNGIF